MDPLKHILPARLYDILEKAGICTMKQIIVLSIWDIKKATNLFNDDITLLKNIVSKHCSPNCTSGHSLENKHRKIKTGCGAVDKVLNGGFQQGTLTEIYGESGTGKTQIVMQSAAHCGSSGCVFICTEDLFPVKRFNQISQNIWHDTDEKFMKNLYIEHLTESHEMLSCIRVRLPKLLQLHNIAMVIIDSVAAPFRCENINYIQRAEELKELAILLLNLAEKYNLAVVCINQVTACFNGSDDVLPTLGLVWSNMISYRLKLTKISKDLRKLVVAFGPDLPSGASAEFKITMNGLEDEEIDIYK